MASGARVLDPPGSRRSSAPAAVTQLVGGIQCTVVPGKGNDVDVIHSSCPRACTHLNDT